MLGHSTGLKERVDESSVAASSLDTTYSQENEEDYEFFLDFITGWSLILLPFIDSRQRRVCSLPLDSIRY